MTAPSVDPFAGADLLDADAKDADQLRKAEAELAKRDAARKAAEDQRDAAKAAVLDAVMAGRDDSRAAAALASANAALAAALEVRDLHAEGVETIRRRIVSVVRERRAAPIRAQLEATRAAYDQEARLLEEVFPIAEALTRHRAREHELAVQLADALRESRPAKYQTIPDVSIAFAVTRDRAREDVASAAHMADKLRRREV